MLVPASTNLHLLSSQDRGRAAHLDLRPLAATSAPTAAQPPRLLTTVSAPFSLADAAPAAAETGCCATEARTPRRPGHRVHPATHNRPNTGAQPPYTPPPSIGLWSTILLPGTARCCADSSAETLS